MPTEPIASSPAVDSADVPIAASEPPASGPDGHLADYRANLLGFLLKLAREHGPIATYRLRDWRQYLLTDPALIAEPLLANPRAYVKNRFVWKHNGRFLGEGLLTSEGNTWRRKRLVQAKAFQPQHLERYAEVMTAYAEAASAAWVDGEVRDLHREMMKLTARIVARTLLGIDYADADEHIVEAMETILRELPPRTTRRFAYPDWIPTAANRRWNAALRQLDRTVHGFIDLEASRAAAGTTAGTPRTLLAILMAERDEDGRAPTRRQLRDDILTLFFAGHETTAAGLSWTLWLLSQHADVQARLVEEVDAVVGGGPVRHEHLPRLEWAARVIRESHRLYPPVYLVGRTPVADHAIAGCPVGKGSVVQISSWVLHRDPQRYPEPEAFKPERWTPAFEAGLPRFGYLPFGGGPRTCIGERYAIMESLIVLATIVRDWRFEYTGAKPPRPQVSLTLKPGGGVPMRLVRRR
jgi:cytochrome P450